MFFSRDSGIRPSALIPILLCMLLALFSCTRDDGPAFTGTLSPALMRSLPENPSLFLFPASSHTSAEISKAISGGGVTVPVDGKGAFSATLRGSPDGVRLLYLVKKDAASSVTGVIPVGFKVRGEFLTRLPLSSLKTGVDFGILDESGGRLEFSKHAGEAFDLPEDSLELMASLDDSSEIADDLLVSYLSGGKSPERFILPSFLWKAGLESFSDGVPESFFGSPASFFPDALLDADLNEVPADQYCLFDAGRKVMYQGENSFSSLPEKISIVFDRSEEFFSYVPAAFVPMNAEGRVKLPVPGFSVKLDPENRISAIDVEWRVPDGNGSSLRIEDPSILTAVMDANPVLIIRDADGGLQESVPVIPGRSTGIKTGYVWQLGTGSEPATEGIGIVDAFLLRYRMNGAEYRFELRKERKPASSAPVPTPVERLPVVKAIAAERPKQAVRPIPAAAPPVSLPAPAEVRIETVPVPPPPRTREISVRVLPEDSLIYLDGILVGRGSYSASMVYGERSVEAVRDGYSPISGRIVVSDESPSAYEYALERIPVSVEVTAEPADSEIFLDGSFVGLGGFRELFKPGTPLRFSVRKAGYAEKNLQITAGSPSSGTYRVRLEELLYRVELSSAPDDGEILLDSKTVGIGTYSGLHKSGERLPFSVRHPDYYERELPVVVQPKDTNGFDVRLVPKAIPRTFAVSNARIVGLAAAPDGRILATDARGIVYAASPDGTVRWKTASGNEQHDNPSIMISGGSVLVSGVKTLASIDLDDGHAVWQTALTAGSQHAIGRHVVPAGDMILLPKNDSIAVLKESTGEQLKSIPVPEGFLSTPAAYGDLVLAANNFGRLLALNPSDGTVGWSVQTGAVQPVETEVRVRGDLAFFYGRNGTVVCVNLPNRKVQWKSDAVVAMQSRISQELEFGTEAVYVFARNSILGLSSADGSEIFAPLRDAATPPLCRDGILYYGSLDGCLLKADAGTGKILGKIVLDDVLSCRPVRVADRIVCGSKSGTIYVLNPEGVQK